MASQGPIAANTDAPDELVLGDNTRITASLYAEGDPSDPADLTTAGVTFAMRRPTDVELLLYKSATADIPASGTVHVDIESNDLVLAGEYVYEWAIDWTMGVRSTSQLGTITVRKR